MNCEQCKKEIKRKHKSKLDPFCSHWCKDTWLLNKDPQYLLKTVKHISSKYTANILYHGKNK